MIFSSKTFDHFCCSHQTSIAWERKFHSKATGLAAANAVEALEALHPNTWAPLQIEPLFDVLFFGKQPLIHRGNLMHGEAENDGMLVLSNSFLCFWVSMSNFRLQGCRYHKYWSIGAKQTMTSKPWIGWHNVEVLRMKAAKFNDTGLPATKGLLLDLDPCGI